MRSILITGGSGTFGQAFARHAIAQGVERICIYSRGEHRQAMMREALGDPHQIRWLIGDVRDSERLRRAMQGCDTVIHAAALKRIEVCAYNPLEVVATNVYGAGNVIAAAQDACVRRVVALSTDKAWQPCSAYGYSKALAESLFLAANNTVGAGGPRFACVRYGNIWGSAGSVVPRWLATSGAIRVTDPECTRFFMRIEEAVALVWHTAKTMRGGELIIPDSLPAYRVGDLVAAMGREYEVIGLPGHEKLHEGMRDGLTSDRARRMSIEELREVLDESVSSCA